MIELIETLNFLLALGAVSVALATVFLVIDLKTTQSLKSLVNRYALLVAFLITAASSALTLLYSEVFGFIPCGLCWLQRVFLYPQVFLLGTALWLKDTSIKIYLLILCIPGVLVGLYQHYLQMGGAELITCPTAGAGADCAEKIMFEFGFMTFPLASAITFSFLAVLYYYSIKTSR